MTNGVSAEGMDGDTWQLGLCAFVRRISWVHRQTRRACRRCGLACADPTCPRQMCYRASCCHRLTATRLPFNSCARCMRLVLLLPYRAWT